VCVDVWWMCVCGCLVDMCMCMFGGCMYVQIWHRQEFAKEAAVQLADALC